MAENNNFEVINYLSLFRHGVDDKRRVQIPAKWRPSQPDVELTLILWSNGSDQNNCLLVLPPVETHALTQKLRALPSGDPEAWALRRLLGSNSASSTLDKAGRICLPETLATAAAIESEVLLVGLWDRFEIWNPERYEKARTADAVLAPKALKLI